MPKFQFRIITGASEDACQTKYEELVDSVTHLHDPYTFYLFDQGGVGYLGDTPLFGGDASKFNMLGTNATYDDLKPNAFYFITADCTITDADPATVTHTCAAGSIWITNGSSVPSEISWTNFTTYMARYIAASAIQSDGTNLPSGDAWDATFAGDNDTLLTSAATKTLIDSLINAQAILNISFFKKVLNVTLTAADITAGEVTFQTGEEDPDTHDPITATADLSANDHEGDIGLVFFCQTGDDEDDGDDEWVFVNLHNLINIYVADSSAQTTQMTITDDSAEHTKKIKVEVNKATKTVAQYEEIILNAIDTVISHMENEGDPSYPDYDPSNATDDLSSNKFISESQLADILAHVLIHFAQVIWGSADPIIDDGDDL